MSRRAASDSGACGEEAASGLGTVGPSLALAGAAPEHEPVRAEGLAVEEDAALMPRPA